MEQLRSLGEQILRLKKLGLVIEDEISAGKFLTYCNYCRFTEYGKVFKKPDSGYTYYKYDIHWEQIKALYLFDVELSTLIFNALLKIEVYLRNALAQLATESGDSFVLFRKETYKYENEKESKWIQELIEIDHELCPNPEETSQTISSVGKTIVSVPQWHLMEHLTFNQLARLFSMLDTPYANLVAKRFGHFPVQVISNWFFALGNLRNMCAHAKRIWNSTVRKAPQIPRKRTEWKWFYDLDSHQQECKFRIFVLLTMIANLMQIIQNETDVNWNWRTSIKNLLHTQKPDVPKFYQEFGIPISLKDSWENLEIWKE